MPKLLQILCLCFSLVFQIQAREAKEYDKDVQYDESKLPPYDLPPLLTTSSGQSVETPEAWMQQRRPEILSLFANLIYGRVPAPAKPIEVSYEVVLEDEGFMDGMATRKDVKIHLENAKGRMSMHFLVFMPNNAQKPVPAFLKHSFNNTQSDDFDASITRPGFLKNKGGHSVSSSSEDTAFVRSTSRILSDTMKWSFSIPFTSFSIRRARAFQNPTNGASFRHAHGGASRAMDYLETDPAIDHSRIAIMGHSKMGKATLWTAAQDERFALAISAQSGCAGAALWRRKSGETLKKMVTRFPYWLCRNAWKFIEQEDDLPVDQHMLLACIAPGRFMCTVPPTIPGQIQEVNISQPIMPARSTSCSAKRHWNPPSSRKSASPLSNRM